jgi:hypothetical protein
MTNQQLSEQAADAARWRFIEKHYVRPKLPWYDGMSGWQFERFRYVGTTFSEAIDKAMAEHEARMKAKEQSRG